MTDRITLRRMVFVGHHGLTEAERARPQPLEVDVELHLNLQPAGVDDDIARTADYGHAFQVCREIVEATNFQLLEAIAEGIAQELLTAFPQVGQTVVRVRKLQLPLMGTLDHAEIEIVRGRRGRGPRSR
jgi:7,8-dihydroneopterin aldolase/epimerase/oxygenase